MTRILSALLLSPALLAQSVLSPADDNSPQAQLASFELAEGYEVSLFADESLGIANPIAIRFDSRGRLWVLCSLVYPQIVPGEKADDHLVILEDTDGDGRADQRTIFAAGLDMPTGFALGDGGVYLGEGTDLVFLRDTDGDDRADSRELVFSGFGTGDTHQNLNSFTWSPSGELFFGQGLHAFSRIETPWGIESLDEHGMWRLRPRRRELHAFPSVSGQNPWGTAFGQWGEPFAKSNNQEVSELLPLMVPTTHRHPPLDIGGTKIKSMMVEIVDSLALPADLQGDMLIAGYFARNIGRLGLEPDGSGHRAPSKEPLMTSTHPSFRPVDLRIGPDGTLYVADWFNPIIGHYQASFRHPDRDRTHGRIWRIRSKNHAPRDVRDLSRTATRDLVGLLESEPLAERERIRIELSRRPDEEVLAAAAGLPEAGDRGLFEVLALSAWREAVPNELLKRALTHEKPMLRAYALRRWSAGRDRDLEVLEQAVADEHPRVRLEAVVAAAYLEKPKAMRAAARILDQPTDRFLVAALTQTAHALKPVWLPALTSGALVFDKPEHLAFVLTRTSGNDAVQIVRDLLAKGAEPAAALTFHELLAALGGPGDLRQAFEAAGNDPRVLAALVQSAEVRQLRPDGDPAPKLRELLQGDQKPAAVKLAGLWQIESLAPELREMAAAAELPAIAALGHFGDPETAALLERLGAHLLAEVRHAALSAWVRHHPEKAAARAVEQLREGGDARRIVAAFLDRSGGLKTLAEAIEKAPLDEKSAADLRAAVQVAGRHSPELDAALSSAPAGSTPYDPALVARLTEAAKTHGDPAKGAAIYARPQLTCTACHKVGETGGTLGPDLSAVGSGLPYELIIESLLWPDRQIKEGYVATTLETHDGRLLSGYVHREDKREIVLRPAAGGPTETIGKASIARRDDAGSLMPPNLTATLDEAELADLVRYLAELK